MFFCISTRAASKLVEEVTLRERAYSSPGDSQGYRKLDGVIGLDESFAVSRDDCEGPFVIYANCEKQRQLSKVWVRSCRLK
jgi:hypothetical protein